MKPGARDKFWMRKAIKTARGGWGTTSPNPVVGAVVVKNGREVGRGYHHRAGDPHAEVHALAAAGKKCRRATLYVTLEPCSTAGRTPPCVAAIVEAGIKRVVIGNIDPNPLHAGRGVRQLRDRGIDVMVGVCTRRAQRLNEAFYCWIRHHRPYVILKMAITVDGRIATASGQSKWISGPASRKRVQHLRQWADAILVGGETIRRDNSQLLVRTPRDWAHQPIRIVVSRSKKLGVSPNVLSDDRAETQVVTFESSDEWQDYLLRLGEQRVTALLVEGGGEIAAELLNAGLIDKLVLFMAPKIMGGGNSRPCFAGPDPETLADIHGIRDMQVVRCGEDFMITGYLTDVHRLY